MYVSCTIVSNIQHYHVPTILRCSFINLFSFLYPKLQKLQWTDLKSYLFSLNSYLDLKICNSNMYYCINEYHVHYMYNM